MVCNVARGSVYLKSMSWQEIDFAGKKRGLLVVEVTISYVMEFTSEKVLLMVGQKVRVHYKVGSNHDWVAILPLNFADSLR